MTLNIKAAMWLGCILGGGTMLFFGVLNLVFPPYAEALLRVAASIYPGYHFGSGLANVIVGVAYAAVDCAIGGAIVAWLYNRLLPTA